MSDAPQIPPAQLLVATERTFIAAKAAVDAATTALETAQANFRLEEDKMRDAATAFTDLYGAYLPKASAKPAKVKAEPKTEPKTETKPDAKAETKPAATQSLMGE